MVKKDFRKKKETPTITIDSSDLDVVKYFSTTDPVRIYVLYV